jgi:FkbM family methyltransferase
VGLNLAPARDLQTLRGVLRSLRIYRLGGEARARQASMDHLYSRFIRAGDLTFDIGSHVGDRVACFRRLGARVVAVEPQPALARTLRLLHRRDDQVMVEETAVGRQVGSAELHLNPRNPTVSTLSTYLIAAARRAPAWQGQRWTRQVRVPVTTLDRLIERHGEPAFVKIDVEGLEAEVLEGLSRPVPALSFEFTTIQRPVALEAVDRCHELGYRWFNVAVGESQQLVLGQGVAGYSDAAGIRRWLLAQPESINSGDVYASLDAAPFDQGAGARDAG